MKSLVQIQLSRSEEVFMFDSDEVEENEDEEEDRIADSDEYNCTNDPQIILIEDCLQ